MCNNVRILQFNWLAVKRIELRQACLAIYSRPEGVPFLSRSLVNPYPRSAGLIPQEDRTGLTYYSLTIITTYYVVLCVADY